MREQDHGLRTSTSGSVSALAESAAIPVARNAVPGGMPERTARSREPRPFGLAARSASGLADWVAPSHQLRDLDRLAGLIPSRAASSGESSTCWWAIVYCSAGEISTSGEAQIGR